MILSDYESQRSDMILCMVRHWLGLRTNPRSIDIITMGSYVTYIGHKLGTQLGGEDICRISPVMDDKALHVSHFIRISRRLTGRGATDSLLHLLQGRSDVETGVHHGRSSRRTSSSTLYTTDECHDGGHPEFLDAASSRILTSDRQSSYSRPLHVGHLAASAGHHLATA
jgi:hypothetical protein